MIIIIIPIKLAANLAAVSSVHEVSPENESS